MNKQNGFSFLEVLAVVFIFSLLATAVVAIIPSQQNNLQRHAQPFIALLRDLGQQAVLDSQDYGLSIAKQSIRVFRWQSSGWLEDKVIARRSDQSELSFHLTVQGEEINFDTADKIGPQMIFFADGSAIPFQWRISQGGPQLILQGDILGRVQILEAQIVEVDVNAAQ